MRTSIRCAFTRTRLPERRTLPSTTFATPSCWPILRRSRAVSLLYCITDVRPITFRSAIRARLLRISSCTPSAKNALSESRLRLSNGSTAMLFSGGGRNKPLFQIFQLTATAKAINETINAVTVGLRCTHLHVCVRTPLRLARIGSCLSQCSRSSASARADGYRRFGSFAKHFRQIMESSRSTFLFRRRGSRGSVSTSNRIVSEAVSAANGG